MSEYDEYEEYVEYSEPCPILKLFASAIATVVGAIFSAWALPVWIAAKVTATTGEPPISDWLPLVGVCMTIFFAYKTIAIIVDCFRR